MAAFLAPATGVVLPATAPETTWGQQGLWIETATDLASLEKHRPAWQALARQALEPNAFLEPFFLLAALRHFGAGQEFLFVMIYRSDPAANGAPMLCGFLPLVRCRSFKGLPIATWKLWKHEQCLLGTPLVRRGQGRDTWRALLDWLESAPESAPLIQFPQMAADGPVYQALADEIRERGVFTLTEEGSTRALLRVRASGEAYLQESLSGNRRRDYKRKEKRLAELGKLEYRVLESEADLPCWLDEFLRLEASGWKGAEGTALACSAATDAFFREMARTAFAQGQLHLIGLFLNDRPIALRCNLTSAPGSFFYKPGYDEAYAKYSPGVLVELQNIQEVHRLAGVRFMDSCTSSDNELLNDLWLDRVLLHDLVLATGKGWGRLALSTLPLLRWAHRTIRGR